MSTTTGTRHGRPPREEAKRPHPSSAPTGRVDATICALNAVIGDYLRDRGNALAIPMELRHANRPLSCDRQAIAEAYPDATGKLCILVHGMGVDERTWCYPGDRETTYGSLLHAGLGYTPFYVRYNTGLHVSDNGESLARLLEALVRSHPVEVEEIVLIGHSLGGLVLRSACHLAALRHDAWVDRVRRVFYIGSPHRGAPLEKLGYVVAWVLRKVGVSHTDLVADVIDLRSSGIKDLRYGSLLREDWEGAEPGALLENRRAPVPFLPTATHHLLAGTLAGGERHLLTALVGDAMVRVASAAGREGDAAGPAFPPRHVTLFPGVGHLALAHHPDVYAEIEKWCAAGERREVSG